MQHAAARFPYHQQSGIPLRLSGLPRKQSRQPTMLSGHPLAMRPRPCCRPARRRRPGVCKTVTSVGDARNRSACPPTRSPTARLAGKRKTSMCPPPPSPHQPSIRQARPTALALHLLAHVSHKLKLQSHPRSGAWSARPTRAVLRSPRGTRAAHSTPPPGRPTNQPANRRASGKANASSRPVD